MLTRFYSPIARQARQMSAIEAKIKMNVKMDDETLKKIEADELKPRKHPGRMSTTAADLPGWLPKALEKALQDAPLTAILADGVRLDNFLHSRNLPLQQSTLQSTYAEVRAQVESKRQMDKIAKLSVEELDKQEHAKTLKILKAKANVWAPVQYNKYASLLYLVSRSSRDYAVLHRIFAEIAARDTEFRPATILDFGSGVGTSIWAASQLWPRAGQEYMCIDVSTDMNDLSQLILGHMDPPLKGLYHRQYLPLSNRTYDMVVNAYSLLEMPNMETRLDAVAKLWAKTQKYLVIVEQGTNAGFTVVNEAREFILHLEGSRREKKAQDAQVFSPCPHDLRCPRYNDRKDKTPCNFEVPYRPLPLRNIAKLGVERFSYVVLKKGVRTDEGQSWPRIVRPTLVRSKHVICRLCTAAGKLEEIIFTASKHGKPMYRCAKSSRWGDRLPLEIMNQPEVGEELQKVEEENEEEEDEEEEEKAEEEKEEQQVQDNHQRIPHLKPADK